MFHVIDYNHHYHLLVIITLALHIVCHCLISCNDLKSGAVNTLIPVRSNLISRSASPLLKCALEAQDDDAEVVINPFRELYN